MAKAKAKAAPKKKVVKAPDKSKATGHSFERAIIDDLLETENFEAAKGPAPPGSLGSTLEKPVDAAPSDVRTSPEIKDLPPTPALTVVGDPKLWKLLQCTPVSTTFAMETPHGVILRVTGINGEALTPLLRGLKVEGNALVPA